MSADNHSACPFCTKRCTEERDRLQERADLEYGQISRAEYAQLVRDIEAVEDEIEELDYSFAEYYEIYGADTGTVTIDYGGSCRKCGASASFKQEVEIIK